TPVVKDIFDVFNVIVGISGPIIGVHQERFLQPDGQWDPYYPTRQRSYVPFFITPR
ncbi:hypothetical protein A2U01_0061737, partial [Trifolium medium]|nr:hypothetical protein [Trifolium medium]